MTQSYSACLSQGHQTAFLFSEKTGLPFFGEIGKELPFPPANNDTKLLASAKRKVTPELPDLRSFLRWPLILSLSTIHLLIRLLLFTPGSTTKNARQT
ncbi:hypothetical protein IWX49DRAFT_594930 [Phyllosticta citricarpa]